MCQTRVYILLLLLAELGGRELLGLLGGLNLVAHGVELLLLVTLLGETGTGTLTGDPVVTGRSHAAVHDSPDFLSQVLGELGRVSDDDHTTLEGLDGLGESTKGVTVEVVGGLVKDDQVRTLPRAGGKDDLDTLATGETTHAGVRDKLGVETEVGAVLLDLLADKGTELTRGKGLLLVNVGNHLLVRVDELGTGDPGVVGGHHGSPTLGLHAEVLTKGERTLVLIGVLELSAGVHADDATVGVLDLVDLVHGLLVLLGDDLVGAVHGLTVLTSLETPLDVLGGSKIEVVVDVSESVLLDVGDTDVLVLVDVTRGGDKLTSQDVDKSGLASTVGANDGNTRAERALEGDVLNLGLAGAGVLEGHVANTDNGLGLGLDTLEETGLGELELHVTGTKLVVGPGRGDTLDELGELAAVTLQLEALVVDDVLDDVVKELAVVRDDDGGARGVDEVVLEPLDVLHVHVVGGLVEKENVGLLKDGTGKSQLHLPATREGGDGTLDLLLVEAELEQTLLDVLVGKVNADLAELLDGPGDGGHLSVGRVKIVLDVDSLDLALLGEALDLLVVDGAHEGGLSGTVGAEETVTLAALQAESGLVEQDLGTVGQVEGAVAEILTLLLIGLDNAGSLALGHGAEAQVLDDVLCVVTNDGGNVGAELGGPAEGLHVLVVDQVATDGGDVLEDGAELLDGGLVLGAEDALELLTDGLDVTSLGNLGELAVVANVTDTLEGGKTLLGLLTGLGVSQVVVVVGKLGHELGQERGNNVGVLDKLAHVVNNDGGFTLDGGLALLKTTLEQRGHDGEGRLVDVSDESGGTEQVDGLGDVLRLGDTLDKLGDETLDILVGDQGADLLHGAVGLLLDLGLGVPHGLRDNGEKLGNAETGLDGGALGEGLDTLEVGHLLGPLLGLTDALGVEGDDDLDGVGVDSLGDGDGGVLGGDLDGGHLVADGGEDDGQEGGQVGLDNVGDIGVGGDGGDSLAGVLAAVGVLLVGEHLLDALHELGRGSLSLDVAVDELGDLDGGALGLIADLADGQLGHQLVEDGDGLLVLFLLSLGHDAGLVCVWW